MKKIKQERKKRKEANYQHQNEIGDIMCSIEIKVIIRQYYEKFCNGKYDNLD